MKKQPRRKKKGLKVGDRVRFRLGTRDVVADVVEDRGPIGVGGRQLVAVALVAEDGEVRKFEMPVEKLVVVETNTHART